MTKPKPKTSKPVPAKTVQETEADKKPIDLQAATLVGDTRDQILELFKEHAYWKGFNETKQREIVNRASNMAEELMRKMAEIIAARGFSSIPATLKQVVIKDGLKMVLEASKMIDCRRDLIDHQGGGVTVVLKDISPFLGHRSEPKIDKDQPELPIGE